jgi:hypothetical protein
VIILARAALLIAESANALAARALCIDRHEDFAYLPSTVYLALFRTVDVLGAAEAGERPRSRTGSGSGSGRRRVGIRHDFSACQKRTIYVRLIFEAAEYESYRYLVGLRRGTEYLKEVKITTGRDYSGEYCIKISWQPFLASGRLWVALALPGLLAWPFKLGAQPASGNLI